MKGVDPLIAFVLVVAITLAAIATIMSFGVPAISKYQEDAVFNEAKKMMTTIETNIRYIAFAGEGAQRTTRIEITDGTYFFNSSDNTVTFKMETDLFGSDYNITEENLNIFSENELLKIQFYLDNIDITEDIELAKGPNRILIKNIGWNDSLQKQQVEITKL